MINTGSLLSSRSFVTIHLGSGSHMLKLIKFHWRFPTRFITLTRAFFSPPSAFQTTGAQSSERASKARGGPVGLAQYGRRGRRRGRRGQNGHAATPAHRTRPLFFHVEACGRPYGSVAVLRRLFVADQRRAFDGRNATPRI